MKISLSLRSAAPIVRADYWAALAEDELIIVDTDKGNMSVTNDLEAVLLEIWRHLIPTGQDMRDLKIRYRDSAGVWDRIVIRTVGVDDHSFTAEIFSGADQVDPDLELFKKQGVAIGSLQA